MTFREAVKQSKKVLIQARGLSFKTTKKEIKKAVMESDHDVQLRRVNVDRTEMYSHAFHWNGVHVSVYCWDNGTVLTVDLTPSYA